MRFRFGEADRETYGDQWHEVDPNAIDDPRLTAGLIERWEDACGYTLMVTLSAGLIRGEHRALRAVMWLGLLADGSDVQWGDFWPNVRAAEFGERGDDGGNRQSPAKDRATTGTGRSTAKRSASTSTTTS